MTNCETNYDFYKNLIHLNTSYVLYIHIRLANQRKKKNKEL